MEFEKTNMKLEKPLICPVLSYGRKNGLKKRKQIRNSWNVVLPNNDMAKLREEKDKRKHIVRTSHKRLTLGTNYNKENGIL